MERNEQSWKAEAKFAVEESKKVTENKTEFPKPTETNSKSDELRKITPETPSAEETLSCPAQFVKKDSAPRFTPSSWPASTCTAWPSTYSAIQ